ncbi:MAG TPA: family 43 glycosylhydrolase [Bacteroidales bacterium]|nr:family 43 glycosylhydrolase [Bacteroidales bacterium]
MKKLIIPVLLLVFCATNDAQTVKIKIIDNGGSGQYEAVAAKDSTLPDFVVYRPKDINKAVKKEGKLPVMVWANGGCMNSSIHQERFLSEISSHGYIVVAIGALQMTVGERPHRGTPDDELLKALDWISERATTKGNDYYKRVDLTKIAAGGHSCGGAQTLRVADDPRIKTYLMLNAGMGDMTMAGAGSKSLENLHGPIVYMIGGESDVAYKNALLDYDRIDRVPVVFANHATAGHGATFAEEFGGSFAQMTLHWLDWQFKGKDNSGIFLENKLSAYPAWTMKSKGFDTQAEDVKSQPVNPFGNALVPDMIADASIQEINGVFYCYATTDGYGRGLETSGPPVVWKSKDFVHWSFDGTHFPSAMGQKYWAPSKAIAANGKYYIYPTVNEYMYAAVADSPEGPFKLAAGPDTFIKPYSAYTLLKSEAPRRPAGIDAEVFIDDDQQAYLFWQSRRAAKLGPDMVTVDTNIITIPTPRTEYSEGPIFFKRKGIYYYLYTIGGDEKYTYSYVTSKVSPLGPFDFPPKDQDVVCMTNYERQIFGPGHGCVFNVPGTDDYYLAYLEFGRGSTNRQTYVNKLEFNADGSIRPVDLTMTGVGALRNIKTDPKKLVKKAEASSVRADLKIRPQQDFTLNRVESFVPWFAFDGANGSRWMPAPEDTACWLVADLGKKQAIKRSEVYFVRPTAGHSYLLEYSNDGTSWTTCGGHSDVIMKSPHTDHLNIKARYLRIRITGGVKGVWEWNMY